MRSKTRLLALGAALLGINATLCAEDINLKDGTIFHDAVVTESDEASATIRHKSGIARVDLADLPDALREKLAPHYDPQKAAAKKDAERKVQEQAAAVSELQASTQQLQKQLDESSISFSGKISQITNDGALMSGGGMTPDQTKMVAVHGSNTMPVAVKKGEHVYLDAVFVVGAGENNVDGDAWRGRIWPAGRYTFTTVAGASRTVARYAVSRELAMRLLLGKVESP